MTTLLVGPLLASVATDAASAPAISVPSAMLILIGIALGFIWSLLLDIRRRLERIETERSSAPPPRPAAASTAPVVAPTSPALTPDVVAVIAAAVHATVGGRHHIVAVSAVDTFAWSLEGRRTVLHSHKVR